MRASIPASCRTTRGVGTLDASNSSAAGDAPVQQPPFPKQSLHPCFQRQQDVQLSGAFAGSQPLGVLALKHASHVAFVRAHNSQSVQHDEVVLPPIPLVTLLLNFYRLIFERFGKWCSRQRGRALFVVYIFNHGPC